MTFDWTMAWSVMGVIALVAAIVFCAMFVVGWMEDKWGVNPVVPLVVMVMIALFLIVGFAGGGAA